MKITRISLAVVAAAAGLFVMAGPAQAAPPVLQTSSQDLPAATPTDTSGYCSFPVHIDIVAHQKYQETDLPDGTVITHITGYSSATVTNVDSGKSLTYKISGPGTVTVLPDGASYTVDAGGQNLLWTTVANSFTGVPQLAYSTGHVKFSVNASGLTTAYSLSGARTDVCAALA